MHFGLNMECDYLQNKTEQDAFNEVFAQVDLAEAVGLDGVWLAERHFAAGDRGQPSIASVPIILATAIAGRTRRLRVGTGVYVLPLNHPTIPCCATGWSMGLRRRRPSACNNSVQSWICPVSFSK